MGLVFAPEGPSSVAQGGSPVHLVRLPRRVARGYAVPTLWPETHHMDRITAAADYLLDLRRTQRRVAALPDDVKPRSLDEGYRVQELLVRRLLEAGGGHSIGYKIACTSDLAQKALGVDAPFFGVLMSHTTHRSPATLPASDYLVRCAEAEFGFVMSADVPAGTTYTAETIKPFIGGVIPGIEIVDHRYHSWQTVGAPSLLADNAIHG